MLSRSSFSLIFLVVVGFLSDVIIGDSSNQCVYTLYVKTGTAFKSGTNSKISIVLGDATGGSVWVPNLEDWGLMGPHHDYYEWGNLDIFSGRGPCIGAPVCRLNLTSDGTGEHHGWYCDQVDVTWTGPHKRCGQSVFNVNRWLASDFPPFSLTAALDRCMWRHAATPQQVRNRHVVGNNRLGSASE